MACLLAVSCYKHAQELATDHILAVLLNSTPQGFVVCDFSGLNYIVTARLYKDLVADLYPVSIYVFCGVRRLDTRMD